MSKSSGTTRGTYRRPARERQPLDEMQKRFSGDKYRTFTPGNLGSMEILGEDYYDEWARGLSDKQKDAIWSYRERSYSRINDHLRGVVLQTGEGKQYVDGQVALIDKTLAASRVPYNVVTFRGGFKGDQFDAGTAYGSTSLNSMTAMRISRDNGPGGILYRIKVRAGSRGAYVDQINSKDEGELLLPRKKPRKVSEPKVENIDGRDYNVVDVEW